MGTATPEDEPFDSADPAGPRRTVLTNGRATAMAEEAGEVTFEGAMTVLTEDRCLVLLGSHEVGRVAFSTEGRVEVLPVNYGIEGRIIVFRTNAGTKLAAVRDSAVAFEIDGWDPVSGTGWSVMAKGRAEEITTNPGRAAEHLRWIPVHPAVPGDRWHWIAIMPTEITGRCFHVPPAGAKRA